MQLRKGYQVAQREGGMADPRGLMEGIKAGLIPVPAVQNLGTALDLWHTEGQYRTKLTQKAVGVPVSAPKIVGKAFGLQPIELTKGFEASEEIYRVRTQKQNQQSIYLERLANATRRNDMEAFQAALAEAQKYNESVTENDHPELRITINPDTLREHIERSSMPETIIDTLPKEQRPYGAKVLRRYGVMTE
jgi:hypothetical protein